MISDADRAIVFKSGLIPLMTTRTAAGVTLMSFGRREKAVVLATADFLASHGDPKGYRKYKLPATGVVLSEKSVEGRQLSIDDKNDNN